MSYLLIPFKILGTEKFMLKLSESQSQHDLVFIQFQYDDIIFLPAFMWHIYWIEIVDFVAPHLW